MEGANTSEKLVQLNLKSKRKLESITKDISAAFKSGNTQKAKEHIIKLKYYWSVAAHINRLLRERGVTD